jgi:putative ATP-binding cassette transporter
MRTLQFLWRKSSLHLTLAFIASITGGAANVAMIALLQHVVSGGLKASSSVLLTFVALCAIVLFLRMSSQLLLTHLSQRATFQLVMQLCRQIVATPLSKLEKIGKVRLNAALTDDVSILINGLVLIPGVLTQSTVVLLCVVYMVRLSPMMAAILICFLAIGAAAIHVAMRGNRRFLTLAWKDRDLLFDHFRSLLEGVKELKLHRQRRHAFIEQVVPSVAKSYERHNLNATAVFSLGAGFSQILIFAVMALAVFCLPRWFGASSYVASGFIILVLYLMVPLEYLTFAVPNVGRADLALKQLWSLELSRSEELDQRELELEEPSKDREILRLDGVMHKYRRELQDGEFTLGPIDLSIRRGALVFLIGGNGSGKTTLAKILTGLYVPEAGEIRLSGAIVNDENRESYRQHFSAVFHDFYLFDRLLGLEEAALSRRSQEYLTLLQLDRHVTIIDGRFSTRDLSQGQKKRLALLVAYLEDRPIYLFDEWASDQDPFFKDFFYTEMLPDLQRRGKTIVVISHDDRYYNAGTHLIKLVDGMIEFDRPAASVSVEACARPAEVQ